MLSFTKGWLFQYLLDHKPNENLLGIFEKSIEQLVLIHSSLNLIKDKRKLRKRFTQQGLTHYLSKAMKNIQAGMIDYRKRFGKADPLWNQRLKQINLKVLTKNLSITDETKVLIHGDFKPNNIIFNGEEVIIIDWLGMMAGTPWYDLAYLTYQLPKQKQIHLVKMYHDQMRTKSYFTNLSKSQFLNSFLLGKTFQQIVRANSNVGKILQNNNAHYVKEFCSALDALVKLTRKEQ
jgi:thiamine kinase-like enzyme